MEQEINELRNARPTFQGRVVSDKMDKTIIVLVETHKRHPKYGKRVKYSKKYVSHDERNEAKLGDIVTIMGVRPLSATKRFTLVSIDSGAKEKLTDTLSESDVTPLEETEGQGE
jgi:small subunit ribosomal protein S17